MSDGREDMISWQKTIAYKQIKSFRASISCFEPYRIHRLPIIFPQRHSYDLYINVKDIADARHISVFISDYKGSTIVKAMNLFSLAQSIGNVTYKRNKVCICVTQFFQHKVSIPLMFNIVCRKAMMQFKTKIVMYETQSHVSHQDITSGAIFSYGRSITIPAQTLTLTFTLERHYHIIYRTLCLYTNDFTDSLDKLTISFPSYTNYNTQTIDLKYHKKHAYNPDHLFSTLQSVMPLLPNDILRYKVLPFICNPVVYLVPFDTLSTTELFSVTSADEATFTLHAKQQCKKFILDAYGVTSVTFTKEGDLHVKYM